MTKCAVVNADAKEGSNKVKVRRQADVCSRRKPQTHNGGFPLKSHIHIRTHTTTHTVQNKTKLHTHTQYKEFDAVNLTAVYGGALHSPQGGKRLLIS